MRGISHTLLQGYVYFLLLGGAWGKTRFGVVTECTRPGLAALTFDDGPSPKEGRTQEVLDVLRHKGVKATFFVTGNGHDPTFLDENRRKQDLLKRIYSEGHQIGCHTWKHLDLTRGLSKDIIISDMSRLASTVDSVLGGIKLNIMRPPYGELNDTVINLIHDYFDYEIIKWNVDTNDWRHRENVEASMQGYKSYVGGDEYISDRFSIIALHHDPVPKSPQLAEKAIDFLRSRRFKIVTVAECLGMPMYGSGRFSLRSPPDSYYKRPETSHHNSRPFSNFVNLGPEPSDTPNQYENQDRDAYRRPRPESHEDYYYRRPVSLQGHYQSSEFHQGHQRRPQPSQEGQYRRPQVELNPYRTRNPALSHDTDFYPAYDSRESHYYRRPDSHQGHYRRPESHPKHYERLQRPDSQEFHYAYRRPETYSYENYPRYDSQEDPSPAYHRRRNSQSSKGGFMQNFWEKIRKAFS